MMMRIILSRRATLLGLVPVIWMVGLGIAVAGGSPSEIEHRLARIRQEAPIEPLRLAIKDLILQEAEAYPDGPNFLRRLDEYERRLPALETAARAGDEAVWPEIEEILSLRRAALLANPHLDFDEILLVHRDLRGPVLGLPHNWESNSVLPRQGYDDALVALSLSDLTGNLRPVFRPATPAFVGDVDLHFDGDRLLYSSIGANGRWQVFELNLADDATRQVTLGDEPDVDHYDACYLPDGRIMFTSNASMVSVPCVDGAVRVANLYLMNADGTGVRQLGFDQEHSWCPTVMNSGRVMYLRWEYADVPHAHSRVLFQANPDGTGQVEYYGSNSYWPNSLFYARPIPGHPTAFVAIVGGHHGVRRKGELVLFDPALGRREADGVIQRIPGRGQPVEPLIEDNLVDNSWPKFLHPYPLSDRHFLVSAKLSPSAAWGLYLVDVFDNLLLLREEPGVALFEPLPLRSTPTPPVIPDRVDLSRDDAIIYMADVYEGGGLAGVPRGAVKQLRIFTYHYLYPGMGGPQGVVGMEGPWDIKRIMGTVPVEKDGSAMFRVPANTPISIQPLDSEGKALQLMRSWFTAMPGETLSCVGCHEDQNTAPPTRPTLAATSAPKEISPWLGPTRGFSFAREVQPVLDRYCIDCHDGGDRSDDLRLPNLKERGHITDYNSVYHDGGNDAGHFSVAYAELHRFVRRPGLESDYRLLMPLEFHADTTELAQMLRQGHHGVELSAEAWDRLITWIDLNAPYHGTWTEIAGPARVASYAQRRRELIRRFAGLDENPEAEAFSPPAVLGQDTSPPPWAALPAPTPALAEPTSALPASDATGETRRIELGDGVSLELVLIPAGVFVMGDQAGHPNEWPATTVRIEEPFWMGRFEVTNEQFREFDPAHDSRVESRNAMQFGVRGWCVNGSDQPVVRVSWNQAMAFCEWLSEQIGEPVHLPTEAQWEYACRAGTSAAFHFGDADADFSAYANLADLMLREFVSDPYRKERVPYSNPGPYDDWLPKDERFNDGGFVSEPVGRYRHNPWGLHDMHGNVAEWTRSVLHPYPYRDDDGRNEAGAGLRVVRGGSWRDRPDRARSAFRRAHRPYQGVFDVGFRVVIPARRDAFDSIARGE